MSPEDNQDYPYHSPAARTLGDMFDEAMIQLAAANERIAKLEAVREAAKKLHHDLTYCHPISWDELTAALAAAEKE